MKTINLTFEKFVKKLETANVIYINNKEKCDCWFINCIGVITFPLVSGCDQFELNIDKGDFINPIEISDDGKLHFKTPTGDFEIQLMKLTPITYETE